MTVVTGAVAVIAYIGGAISQIAHFPIYAKVPLFLFGALFVVTVALRLWSYLRHRKARGPEAPPPGSVSMTLLHQEGEGQIHGLYMEGNQMTVDQGPAPIALLVPSSPELLERLAQEMEDLSHEVLDFIPELGSPPTTGSSEEWDRHIAQRREAEQAAVAEYRRTLHPRVVQLYEQARSRGFPEERLEGLAVSTVAPNLLTVGMVADLFGIIAQRIRFHLREAAAADQADEGNGATD